MTEPCFDTCDDIDLLTQKNCSFALYRLPSAAAPVMLIQTTGTPALLHSLDELEGRSGFLFSPFHIDEEHPVILMQPDVEARGWEAIGQVFNQPETSRLLHDLPPLEGKPDITPAYSFSHYTKDFSTFIRPLSDRLFDKLVLSRKTSHKRNEAFSPMHTFRKAVDKYPSAFVYLFHSPVSGTWFGCTPEVLLTYQNGQCHTMALAGTHKPHSKNQSDLLPEWDEKNLTEQEIVSDFIRRKLNGCGLEWEERGPYTQEAGRIAHLLTDFHFYLPAEQVLRVARMLYPSPAICGLPQQTAYRFILENESCDREYYSGIVGWIEREEITALYINLRCMQIGTEKLTLYAGGGLLPSSRITAEWKETQDKLQTLLTLIK